MIKAKNVIKKKFKDLHDQRLAFNERILDEYKPIIQPLTTLVETNNSQLKNNNKKKKNVTAQQLFESDENGANFIQPKKQKKTLKTQVEEIRSRPLGHSSNSANISSTNLENLFSDVDIVSETQQNNSTSSENNSTNTSSKVPVRTKPLSSTDLSHRHYTVQKIDGELYLGGNNLTIKNNAIVIKNKKFTSTPGLLELLLKRNPLKYDPNDLNLYKIILQFTNAHRTNFSASGQIVRDPLNVKYKHIIKHLFPSSLSSSVAGEGVGRRKQKNIQNDYMIYDKSKKAAYTYWDDPNELVERLQLLTASKSAGHSGHNNEIISILEELREANIIN